jgi:hypothetical protein
VKEGEVCQIIELPVKDFALRYKPDASQRALNLTRRHPVLVQLFCSEIVAFKNEQPPAVRCVACSGDVEATVPETLSHGSFFLADFQQNQVDAAYLAISAFWLHIGKGAAIRWEELACQFPDGWDNILDLLTSHELIEGLKMVTASR